MPLVDKITGRSVFAGCAAPVRYELSSVLRDNPHLEERAVYIARRSQQGVKKEPSVFISPSKGGQHSHVGSSDDELLFDSAFYSDPILFDGARTKKWEVDVCESGNIVEQGKEGSTNVMEIDTNGEADIEGLFEMKSADGGEIPICSPFQNFEELGVCFTTDNEIVKMSFFDIGTGREFEKEKDFSWAPTLRPIGKDEFHVCDLKGFELMLAAEQ